MNRKISGFIVTVLTALFLTVNAKAELLDRIVAVVEEDVILDRELSSETNAIIRKLEANKVMIPPAFILRKQVLERMILDRLQRQLAERSGIRVGDEMLRNSVMDIAERNGLNIDEFRGELQAQGINFNDFEESIRSEIVINRLRAREIGSRILVTDREISHYQETQGAIGEEQIEYYLGHILIAIPEAASSSVIQRAKEKANGVVSDLLNGADFQQTAVAVSDAGNALQGGVLGWRETGEIPTLFVDQVIKMNKGDISELIRSPSGFHIIKLLELKGLNKHFVVKTKVRHILIKINEIVDDKEAREKLLSLKERIIDGDGFATLARSNSDDRGSALNGGGLDWVGPGDLVAPFEAAMSNLEINEISDPVQTQFGWHIIQVLAREGKDNSIEHNKNLVREEIRKRKIEEETELWLRRLRDEAFVDINLDRL